MPFITSVTTCSYYFLNHIPTRRINHAPSSPANSNKKPVATTTQSPARAPPLPAAQTTVNGYWKIPETSGVGVNSRNIGVSKASPAIGGGATVFYRKHSRCSEQVVNKRKNDQQVLILKCIFYLFFFF